MTDPYTFPRKYRSCMNCIHLDGPEYVCGNISSGGCRKRLLGFGMKPEDFKKTYCGQWYLQQLTDNDY